MPYAIATVEAEKRVCLTYERAFAPKEISASLREIEALLSANGWSALSVDVTSLQFIPTAEDLFILSEALPQSVPRQNRIALVVRPDQEKVARLIEHVMRSRGALLTFFTDAQRADDWLRGNLGPSPGVPAESQSVKVSPTR